MSKLEESSDDDFTELIFPCDGNDGDYLRLSWEHLDDKWRWMWIEVIPPRGFIRKLKYCVSIFFGKRAHNMHPSICLNKKSTLSLKEFIENNMQ